MLTLLKWRRRIIGVIGILAGMYIFATGGSLWGSLLFFVAGIFWIWYSRDR
jgi:hypothetical protein